MTQSDDILAYPRKILHLDLDAFYCAVEEQRDPSLIGVPFAVGGRPEERGVVASCSYAARFRGVQSAMPMAHAKRLCPELIIVRPHHSTYSKVSKEVMKRLKSFTPLIEQLSIDEAFLDVSSLPDPAKKLALRIQKTIREDLNLPCSIGAASNKLLAKTANDVGKTNAIAIRKSDENGISNVEVGPPNAITVVPPGEEAEFLAPLPVRALWGVGPKTAEKLSDLGIQYIGDLASYEESKLGRLFGKNGYDLARRAKGIDDRPIITHHEPKSISQEITFARDESDGDRLIGVLNDMSERISQRLTKAGLICSTVKLKLRWPNFDTLTRQTTLNTSTDAGEIIYQSVTELLMKEWEEGQAVRLIGVGVSGLAPPIRQLTLWDDALTDLKYQSDDRSESQRTDQLQQALDALRQRYGEEIIQPASTLRNEKE